MITTHRKQYVSLGLWALGAWLVMSTLATPAHAQRFKLRWGGEIGSNLFVGLQPSTDTIPQDNLGKLFNYRNTNHIGLLLIPRFGRRVAGRANMEFRNINFSPGNGLTDSSGQMLKSAIDLEDYNKVLPVSVRVNELYIDFYGLIPNVDMRIGQQRIAWGTATIFNPTDNLNPYNLENPLDFQRRLGVPAIKFDIAAGEYVTISLINIFMFTPPVLPITLFREATSIDTSVLVPEGFALGQIRSNEVLAMPAFDVTNFMPAAKIGVDVEGVNFSVSYLFGRLTIPVPGDIPVTQVSVTDGDTTIEINPNNRDQLIKLAGCLATNRQSPCQVNAVAAPRMSFPRVHVIGADFSTSLGGVGLWAEAAVFVPMERIEAKLQLEEFFFEAMELLDPTLKTKAQRPLQTFEQQVFFKLTAGLDYTFPGGWYFNLQYIYGFFNEQVWNELHHYAILAFRKSFFRDRLLIQISAGMEVDSQRTDKEKEDGNQVGLGFIVNPEIHYKPADAATIILGGIVTRGHTGTTLSLFQSLTQVYLRASFKFGG